LPFMDTPSQSDCTQKVPFWKSKSLTEMSNLEWEALCDGCGRCCVHKLEDGDTGQVFFTDVACRLLDLNNGKCSHYRDRLTHVPDCVALSPRNLSKLGWLPKTCAYRRLAEGRDLAWWHPLVSGKKDTVRRAGIAVHERVIPEKNVDLNEIDERIIHWLKPTRMSAQTLK